MANTNAPRGLIPVRNAGKDIRTQPYEKTAAVEIFEGDLLKRVAAGTVQPYVAGDSEPIVGVAAHYAKAAATEINVYDDPEGIFRAQVDGTTAYAKADNGLNADSAAGTSGSATTLLSGQLVDMATKATTATLPLKVLDLADAINQEENSAAINADILVKINRHEQGNLQTGI